MDKMTLLKKVIELTNKINQDMFNGGLTINFSISLSNSGKRAGQIGYNIICGTIFTVKEMKISKNFNWTDAELIDTIAHELIHVWEIQVLKKRPSHGHSFLSKMNSLNEAYKTKINVRHSMQSTKSSKVKKVAYILSEDKKRFLPISLTSLFNLKNENLEKIFGLNFTIGKIESDKIKNFKISRKIRYTYKLDENKIISLGL